MINERLNLIVFWQIIDCAAASHDPQKNKQNQLSMVELTIFELELN